MAVNRSEWVVARAKFGVPRIPNAWVPRNVLVERLQSGMSEALTLIAAPPGSGKTALLSQWVADQAGPVAWLSCDADDADARCFWHDLCTAIHDAWQPFGSIAAGFVDDWGTRQLAVELANELAAVGQEGLIVVDDLHQAAVDPAVMLAFISALPGGVRLVLGSRSDPPFAVARLRVQGKVLELRQHDLRFSRDETRQLLADLGVELANDELEQLDAVTEGWAAAVQLAGLYLHAHTDHSAFVRDMLDTDRSLVDFLVNEVIDLQPPEILDFLLVTAELETFDAALCAAVGGWSNSVELLDRVRTANLFLVELTGAPGSYRYHHLFGQFLRGRLRVLAPNRVRAIHKTAAEAYRERGDLLGAIRHRMQSSDADAAFDDLRAFATSLLSVDDRAEAVAAARALLAQYGVAQLDRAPIKVLDCVMALNTVAGMGDEVARWLRLVEAREADLDLSTRFQLHGVWGSYYLNQGDPQSALEQGRIAAKLQREAPIDNPWQSALPYLLIQGHLWLGDLAAAHAELEASRLPGLPPVEEVRVPGFASFLKALGGELTRAEQLALDALNAADRMGLSARNFGRAEPELAMALIEMEHNQLDQARTRLDGVMQIAEGGRRPLIELLAWLWQARLAATYGDVSSAADLVHQARGVFPRATPPVRAHIDIVEARLAIDHGDITAASSLWAHLPPGPATDLLEARLRVAEQNPGAAQTALARIEASSSCRIHVEHGVLSALALRLNDQDAASHQALTTALRAGQSAGFLMTIVTEGPTLWGLLESLPAPAELAEYVARLVDTARQVIPAPRPVADPGLIEPLSDRELTVLRHLSSRLDSTEIASVLYVSVNTVRTHVKAIYRKLAVNSRADAVARAHALGLF